MLEHTKEVDYCWAADAVGGKGVESNSSVGSRLWLGCDMAVLLCYSSVERVRGRKERCSYS